MVIIGFTKILNLKLESGITFAIIASVFLAGYTLTIKKARAEMETISVLYYALLGSAIPLIIICFIYKLPLLGYSARSYFYLICLGVVTQVGGYFSINYALGHISSIKVSLITLLQPVLTAVFASLIINEIIPSQKLIGGLIVLVGIGISFFKPVLKRRLRPFSHDVPA
jgi:drug/metabolite transporter (DMT)-like permease